MIPSAVVPWHQRIYKEHGTKQGEIGLEWARWIFYLPMRLRSEDLDTKLSPIELVDHLIQFPPPQYNTLIIWREHVTSYLAQGEGRVWYLVVVIGHLGVKVSKGRLEKGIGEIGDSLPEFKPHYCCYKILGWRKWGFLTAALIHLSRNLSTPGDKLLLLRTFARLRIPHSTYWRGGFFLW